MADETLYNKGMAVRRQVLGDAYVDKATANADDFNRDFSASSRNTAGAKCGRARS